MKRERARARRIVGLALLGAAQLALLSSCASVESPAEAQRSPEAAEIRTVRSQNARGVPLHPTATSNEVSGRIPNGATVRVLAWTGDRRRVEVESAEARGFVVARYLAGAEPARREAAAAPPSAFDSPEACARADASAPEAGRAGVAMRVATWNVRWFPDGDAEGLRGEGTDVAWLACAIARLGADVLAVQEFVRHARGRAALDQLLGELARRTGARWRAVFDGCPADDRQHVGFLYREDRIRLEGVRDLADVNGGRSACEHRLRPGLFARAIGPAGFEAELVNVHLDSGVEARDRTHRAAAARAIAELVAHRRSPRPGVVVLGDFNTMGCEECRPRESGPEELRALERTLGAEGLVRAVPNAECTERAGSRSGALDHVFLLGRAGRASEPRARVFGPCADSCGAARARSPFFARLSDHCPVVVDLGGRSAR